ncbi:MAG: PQQ-dependent sugar dehydrogenase [Roseimicrobium sp.]
MKFLLRLVTGAAIAIAALLSVHVTFPGIAAAFSPKAVATTAAPSAAFAMPPSSSGVQLVPAFPNIKVERPIAAVMPPDGSKRIFLVQQRGQIVILPKEEMGTSAPVFLDISQRRMAEPKQDFEMGLLGFAFHPQFAQNGKCYLNYTLTDMMRSVISEVRVNEAKTSEADPATERILIEQPQPFWNHNSGNLAFGPDGFLYAALGDGGKRDDYTRTAQNLFSLLGKILRIDVNRTQGSRAYGIPSDNPLVSTEGARPEIWAYGFRNPWGMSFDADGRLWCADVGQDIWEEVNIITKGGNYGWSFREGARPFVLRSDAPPVDAQFIDPVFEYPHSEGISVTGGFFYRGQKLPQLKGAYICGDWGLGRIWAVWVDKATGKRTRSERIYDSPMDWKGRGVMKPTAFCEDADGEVLVLDWNNALFRLTGV